jgi:hypothetical protein
MNVIEKPSNETKEAVARRERYLAHIQEPDKPTYSSHLTVSSKQWMPTAASSNCKQKIKFHASSHCNCETSTSHKIETHSTQQIMADIQNATNYTISMKPMFLVHQCLLLLLIE